MTSTSPTLTCSPSAMGSSRMISLLVALKVMRSRSRVPNA
ncbi:Uncharacterised protein [Vibrio cholerae]|nr:Uncharacterised protein [Vibrio cholerae]